MSDLNEWIKERRRIHDAAPRGAWETSSAERDAFNTLPTLLTAVENVLKRHQPKYLIRDGEWIPANCAVCEPWTWPCATVSAIEGAINEQ